MLQTGQTLVPYLEPLTPCSPPATHCLEQKLLHGCFGCSSNTETYRLFVFLALLKCHNPVQTQVRMWILLAPWQGLTSLQPPPLRIPAQHTYNEPRNSRRAQGSHVSLKGKKDQHGYRLCCRPKGSSLLHGWRGRGPPHPPWAISHFHLWGSLLQKEGRGLARQKPSCSSPAVQSEKETSFPSQGRTGEKKDFTVQLQGGGGEEVRRREAFCPTEN